jgi:hypothetical protein
VATWAEFEATASELAAAGRRLLVGADGVAIGFLATASAAGRPHLAPVCPIFCGERLYLSVGAHTPKRRDLADPAGYVLHAFLGKNDEEFQIAGRAREVGDEGERSAVHEAIPFPAFQQDDPIFELGIELCLWCWWENVGRPDTRPVRRRWRA